MLHKDPHFSPWPAYADLLAGMLGCLMLIALAALAEQSALARRYREAHDELEQMRLEKLALEEQLARDLEGLIAAGLVDLEDGVVAIRGNLLFESASDQLSPEGQELIERAAPALQAWAEGGVVMVSGHTDDIPIRNGRFDSNWELSAARAITVVSALEGEGLDPDRLFAAGFGEHRPVADNEGPESRAMNRRVELARVALP